MKIELNYLVEYQYQNGTHDHFLCVSYILRKNNILCNWYDSYGSIHTIYFELTNIKELTIKPIGENRIVYSYKREEQNNACNKD